jgi:hypothetical protein
MDPDVVEDAPGQCPRCRMTLVPVRLDTAYSCPIHPAVIESRAGTCRICRRPLVPITVALSFTCAASPSVREIAPGVCADGRARVVVRERRAHGDHNPRHGGEFFMAADNWHHLEGTYPRAGVFRLYLYDDFTKPLAASALAGIRGRATPANADGSPAGPDVPLRTLADRRAFEARVPDGGKPVRVTVRLAFTPGGNEQRFDFVFPGVTHEPRPGEAVTTAPPAATADAAAASSTGTATPSALLDRLEQERQAVSAAVAQGAYTAIYIPALAAKDVALALEAADTDLPAARRTLVAAAVKRIVVAAWRLDMYGDLGDKQQIEASNRMFSEGVDELKAQYAR